MNFLVMPLFFLSGALYPLSNIPHALLWVVRLDPLSYGVDALRHFLIGSSTFGIIVDVPVLLVTAAFFLWLGSHFFSRIEV
jgi:ABC-2 type transport system permease protein